MSAMRSSDCPDAMLRTLTRLWVVGLRFGRIGVLSGGVTEADLELVVRREAVEHGVDHRSRLDRARRVAQHDGEEVVGAQRLQPELAACAHGRRTADAS